VREDFDELVRLHGGAMLRVAKRFLRNEEDARDAVQDAFLSAVRGEFDGRSQVSTWLHRITINTCLMKLRTKRRRIEEESIEPLLPRFRADGHQIESSVAWRGIEEVLQENELRATVREAIERIPDSYRVVLMLRDIEEMTPEETAAALGITRTAVKVRLHRARQALRTLLDPIMRGQ
jgi:RNA polymerase sigma-70 factor (ECF subfamily)